MLFLSRSSTSSTARRTCLRLTMLLSQTWGIYLARGVSGNATAAPPPAACVVLPPPPPPRRLASARACGLRGEIGRSV